ncbi:lysozyme inhibitor LprI family protein [Mycoplana rhizolycopersici]|uniref:DUF1311 domain-containing protein n=1 Tax=Mycoplana rhizolycopersici TaxID=2746702 RepID=A0ABX2QCD5_9HYPH|nr:lysozyme inhibitor LprI family protein [Rhizobium rhizolycopersici]NVP54634.1 DUF1311 domain-containing protein [Rhizobium rhizolycopersici]
MVKTALLTMLCGCVLLVDAPSEEGLPVDCKLAQTQSDMNACAAEDYAAADKALNEQWLATKKAAKVWDDMIESDGGPRGAEDRLLKAQRAWLAYRDSQCEALGFTVQGGTIQPMVVSNCLADLTRKRTEELGQLSDSFVN